MNSHKQYIVNIILDDGTAVEVKRFYKGSLADAIAYTVNLYDVSSAEVLTVTDHTGSCEFSIGFNEDYE